MSYYPSHKRTYKYNTEFSVSFTKFRYFFECERKYILHSYGSWDHGAQDLGLPMDMQIEIKRLKKIDTLDSTAGTAVHSVIAELAGSKKVKTLIADQYALKTIRTNIRRLYEELKSNAVAVTEDALQGKVPGDREKILSEIYLSDKDVNIKDEIIQKKNEKILKKLNVISQNLVDSPIFNEMISDKTEIKLVEKAGFPSIRMLGANLYANIDLSYQFLESKNNIIVDWKTGEPDFESEKRQLLLYALYISEKFFNGNIDPIRHAFFVIEYLTVGKRYTYLLDEEEFFEFKEYLKKNTQALRRKLRDSNSNLPYHITCYKRREEDYVCANCEMKRICLQVDGGKYEGK